MPRRDTTFGMVLGWDRGDPEFDSWYGKLRVTLRHIRKATGYMMADDSTRKLFSGALLAHINALSKNSTRKQITAAYETVVTGLSHELAVLDAKLYEHGEDVKRLENETEHLRGMNKEMGQREQARYQESLFTAKKLDAVLGLLAEQQKPLSEEAPW
jgi:hypothetical protein